MKLYHAKRARSLRVIWMLEEMGLPYDLETVAFPPTNEPAVLAVNPVGTVPVLVDGAVVLTESIAILEYLGRRYGPTPLVPDPAAADYPTYIEYLHFGESTLAAPMSSLVRTRFLAPEDQRENWTAKIIREVFVHRTAKVAEALADRPYVAGEAFTAADISVAYALNFGVLMRLGDQYPPVLHAYLERALGRDAYKRASAK